MKAQIFSYKYHILITLVFILAIVLRFWHIEFGLPHSFYADEPEIAEPAIKYTYELRDIIANGNYYKLIPISYVYGTFPSYLLTAAVMFFSKSLNIAGIVFDKTTLYILMRSINAVMSLAVIPLMATLYLKLYPDEKRINNRIFSGALIAFFLAALNWKMIVHAHYVNPDIILTFLLTVTYITMISYHATPNRSAYIWLAGIFMGLAIGTKITAAISLPLFLYLFLHKKDYKSMAGFLLLTGATFILTNPFSFIFFNDFIFRIYQMLFKEGGLVFDSVDYSPLKYLFSLGTILTPFVFIFSALGVRKAVMHIKSASDEKPIHIFLLGNILIYLIFYSLQSRRVDRWMLPVIPILLVYAAHSVYTLPQLIKQKTLRYMVITLSILLYLYPSVVLLKQFQRYTPKSEAYIWARDNLPANSNRFVITEEGLDPMNKLRTEPETLLDVRQFNVYESKNAQYDYPPDPNLYDYVILSSRPIDGYKRSEVIKKYPEYTKAWQEFEGTVTLSEKFSLIKTFSTTNPNLIPVSEVYIYAKNKQ